MRHRTPTHSRRPGGAASPSGLADECFRAANVNFARCDNYINPDDIWRDKMVTKIARIH